MTKFSIISAFWSQNQFNQIEIWKRLEFIVKINNVWLVFCVKIFTMILSFCTAWIVQSTIKNWELFIFCTIFLYSELHIGFCDRFWCEFNLATGTSQIYKLYRKCAYSVNIMAPDVPVIYSQGKSILAGSLAQAPLSIQGDIHRRKGVGGQSNVYISK